LFDVMYYSFQKGPSKTTKKYLRRECFRDLTNDVKCNLVQFIVLHTITSQNNWKIQNNKLAV